MLTRIICAVLCTVVITACRGQAVTDASENFTGLIKEDGYYHYYEDGEMITSSWREIDGDKYYFKGNGNAAVLSSKISGTYYIFDNDGKLICPKKKKVYAIEVNGETKKYYVNTDGTAASGWNENHKYYFYENGEAAVGTVIINKKFFYFNSNMKYNETRTKKIRKAAKYEKPFAKLKKLIGEPKKSKYYASCYGIGKDGVLKYENFTVYTFKPEKGKEIFMDAE